MSPEVETLIKQLRWLAETGSYPYITVRVEGTGGKGIIAIDRKVLAELLSVYPVTHPEPQP